MTLGTTPSSTTTTPNISMRKISYIMNREEEEEVHEALLLQQDDEEQTMKPHDFDTIMDLVESPHRRRRPRANPTARSTIFGVALACGIFLAAIAFAAATSLAIEFQDAPPKGIYQDTEYYLLYYIIEFVYAAHYIVCLSSVVTLLVLLVSRKGTTRSTEISLALVQTIIFQGGFFAGITATFALIQAFLVPSNHPELATFVAPFVDPLAIVAVVNSCFFLRGGGRRAGGVYYSPRRRMSSSVDDDNREDQTLAPDSVTTAQGNDEHYYHAMVV